MTAQQLRLGTASQQAGKLDTQRQLGAIAQQELNELRAYKRQAAKDLQRAKAGMENAFQRQAQLHAAALEAVAAESRVLRAQFAQFVATHSSTPPQGQVLVPSTQLPPIPSQASADLGTPQTATPKSFVFPSVITHTSASQSSGFLTTPEWPNSNPYNYPDSTPTPWPDSNQSGYPDSTPTTSSNV
ncbi:hypothetical protein EMPS_06695 [Entomortierella parvispora]|uniref:Uncharacterized protein n=1 Tax=Entomortierella parvispora TaxID=205924 RepID=A0A9P3HCY3_9FUNG|nr:hypothetical protein EMPS_06695 [Entomortierella parvispora]